MIPELGTFYEIALLIGLATALGLAGTLLRQPMIVAFIAAGILAGPGMLNIVHSAEAVELLSQISIAVLLFLVGLKLDVGLVKSLGRVAVATGLGQVAFTSLVGFVLCLAMGLDWRTALYVAVALTFSSTIIIVKLLSDKREVDALHGKIALGFLIVQDLFVVFAMVVVSALGLGGGEGSLGGLAALGAGAAVLLGFAAVFIRYLAPPLTGLLSRSGELLVIFAVAWAAGLAAVADVIGLGKELGGLLAGVTLASTPVRDIIGARLASLRDFLLLFFFLSLGATMDLSTLGAQIGPAIVLSVFVLVGNPLIVLAIMGWMGYRRRTGFLAGLTVAQISEFSLIFLAMGIALGHVAPEAMGLVTLVGLVTITVSVYMITWSHHLYEWCAPYLGLFERKDPFREEEASTPDAGARPHDVLVLGMGRYGSRIAEGLAAEGLRPLAVDFDPEAVRAARARGLDALMGDASDPEFLAHLPLGGVRAAVSATTRAASPLTEADAHASALQALRELGFSGPVAVTVEDEDAGARYRAMGAALVLCPFADAADRAVVRLRGLLGEVSAEASSAAAREQ
ncbi:MAG: cation:proton antiporter [Rubricoccaceae bacterium]